MQRKAMSDRLETILVDITTVATRIKLRRIFNEINPSELLVVNGNICMVTEDLTVVVHINEEIDNAVTDVEGT